MKPLYYDNTLVGRSKWGEYFFSIWVDAERASITRYCVPGRLDVYSFSWIPGNNCGIGDKVTFFTDCSPKTTLHRASVMVRKDLKKKYVKALLKEAKNKLSKYESRYLYSLLAALR